MATLNSVLDDLRNSLDPSSSLPITPNTLSQPSTLSFIAEDAARAAAAAVPVAPTVAAPGAPFSAIYAFGDSLTDTGNASLATLGKVPVSPPYADRSFSNGPVWVNDLAQDLGLPAIRPSLAGGTDFAYGSAETGQTPVHKLAATDLPSQYSQFLTQVHSPPAQQQADVSAAVTNEVSVIQGLEAHGAQKFLVLNVPDLGATPYERARGPAVAQSATELSKLYNAELADAVKQMEASGSLKVDLVDMFSVLDQTAANPAAHGFTNVTDPVWTGNVTDPNSGTLRATGAAQDQFLYFDALHPTAHAHAELASGIAPTLTAVA
jgi:phospholipase/lecithinase/hemolysin